MNTLKKLIKKADYLELEVMRLEDLYDTCESYEEGIYDRAITYTRALLNRVEKRISGIEGAQS